MNRGMALGRLLNEAAAALIRQREDMRAGKLTKRKLIDRNQRGELTTHYMRSGDVGAVKGAAVMKELFRSHNLAARSK